MGANIDLRSSAIVDEDGNFLGGKKASIQFAYDLTKTRDHKDTADHQILSVDNEDIKPNIENEEVLEKLTIQTVDKVMKLFDGIKIKEKAKQNEVKRELLLQKLSEFGHFGTSMVKPMELEAEADISQDIKNLIDEVPEEPVLEQKLENEKDVEKAEPTPNQIN